MSRRKSYEHSFVRSFDTHALLYKKNWKKNLKRKYCLIISCDTPSFAWKMINLIKSLIQYYQYCWYYIHTLLLYKPFFSVLIFWLCRALDLELRTKEKEDRERVKQVWPPPRSNAIFFVFDLVLFWNFFLVMFS